LLKFYYVPLLAHGLPQAFVRQPLTVLPRQTRQAVCTINHSIFNMMSMDTPHPINIQVLSAISMPHPPSKVKMWVKQIFGAETYVAKIWQASKIWSGKFCSQLVITPSPLSTSNVNSFDNPFIRQVRQWVCSATCILTKIIKLIY